MTWGWKTILDKVKREDFLIKEATACMLYFVAIWKFCRPCLYPSVVTIKRKTSQSCPKIWFVSSSLTLTPFIHSVTFTRASVGSNIRITGNRFVKVRAFHISGVLRAEPVSRSKLLLTLVVPGGSVSRKGSVQIDVEPFSFITFEIKSLVLVSGSLVGAYMALTETTVVGNEPSHILELALDISISWLLLVRWELSWWRACLQKVR